jgi:serine/threonine-protein kinase ULK/ATG1
MASLNSLSQVQSISERSFEKLNVNREFMSTNFECSQLFFKVLFDLCLGLARLLFPEIVKIRNNLDSLHKVLPTLVLIDDLFILLTLDSVFTYSESTPVNFNAFIE